MSAVRAKLTAFTISGAIAGIAGGLFVHLNQAFSLDQLRPGREPRRVRRRRSSAASARSAGAVLGAVYLRGTQWFITAPEWQFLSSAVGVLLVLLVLPGGLAVAGRQARDDCRRRWRATRSHVPVDATPGRADRAPIDAGRARARRRPRSRRQLTRGTDARAGRDGAVEHAFLDVPSRHPMVWLRDVCGGEPAFPLVVLFGLNAVDELDRTAFGILLPEIRDAFGLDLSDGARHRRPVAGVAALALQVPIAQFADRSKRVPLVVGGALVWACFSGMTGLATTVVVLTIARSGSVDRQGRHRPDAQLAARRLLPDRGPSQGVQLAPGGQRRRRVRRAARRRPARLLRSAGGCRSSSSSSRP